MKCLLLIILNLKQHRLHQKCIKHTALLIIVFAFSKVSFLNIIDEGFTRRSFTNIFISDLRCISALDVTHETEMYLIITSTKYFG